MKLTDKEIEEKYYTMPLSGDMDEETRQAFQTANNERLKQQEAAKWARDKACEWVPVSRELPGLEVLQKHRTGTDYVSDKVS